MKKENMVPMKYYSVIKKHEILPFTRALMKLEMIMQSEISEAQKGKDHSYVRSKRVNIIKVEKRTVVTRPGEK